MISTLQLAEDKSFRMLLSMLMRWMNPDMWYVELALGGSKIHAGCNGKLVWRHTPWLGPHAAKGPVRPLRRALQ
ncbi:hypothetical protein LOK49_LG05G01020 [Camellia lanceoleosa]|uniref:Uncharacterized protein n=1 Tax=Camellia lanceoleosa TaxID=1840588 RepID=A0ACC0HKK6_9ERIC|nr:hypothetical protein LOK49_LG05G01020 [Camellia lanceoleosa]